MAERQLARGLWTGFALTESPFGTPNGMDENLRRLDDHLALYTLSGPQPLGAPLPEAPNEGDGQIFVNGSYAVFNGGSWKTYGPRKGISVMASAGDEVWQNTGTGWVEATVINVQPAIDAVVEAAQPIADAAAVSSAAAADSATRAELAAREFHTVSRIAQRLNMGINDMFVLVQGDSTGNDDYEFFRVMVGMLAPLYPAYTFKYKSWIHASTSWGADVIVQAGTGLRTITFYNGSHPGATPSYWTGNRNGLAYDGKQFDLIISNYGLNIPTAWRYQAERLAEYLYTLRQQQSYADILVTIQPPDYTDATMLERSANRADAQRLVSELYGCSVIDAYALFLELVASSGGDTTPWYMDKIHPTPAGGTKWAEIAFSAFLTNKPGVASSPGMASVVATPNGLPNGNFMSWLKGTALPPTFWLTDTSVVRNTINWETKGWSLRGDGKGSGTGVMYTPANEIIKRYQHWGDIVIAARIYSEGNSGKAGTLYFAHSVNTNYTEIQNTTGQTSESAAGWRWAFLLIPKSFYQGKSDFRLGIFTGVAGEKASCDRIMISPTLKPNDTDLTSSWRYKVQAQDSAFSLPNGVETLRSFGNFTGGEMLCEKGCRVNVSSPDMPVGVGLRAEATGTNQISVRLANFTGAAVAMPVATYSFEVGE